MTLIFNIICLFIIFQFVLFGIFLVFQRKGNRISNNILAVFLFAYALFALYVPLFNNFTGFFFEYRIYFYRITEPLRFLFGPLLFFYTVSLASQEFRFQKKHLWHILPFILNSLILLIFFHLKSFDVRENILNAENWFGTKWLYLNFYVFYTQFFLYLIASLKKIKKYQNNIRNYFSSLEKIKLSWLKTIIIAYIITWGVNLLNIVINIKTFKMNTYLWMAIFSASVIFVLANLMIFKGLQHPYLFVKNQSNPIDKKYKKSPLTKEMKTRYLNRLKEYIEREKSYLNYNLTLRELSYQSKIPVNYLSQVINEMLNKNFYTFINEYRVKEAKRMFADPKYADRSIMEILYEVGFNSKSTFYSFFQKTTGITPSEYRKKVSPRKSYNH